MGETVPQFRRGGGVQRRRRMAQGGVVPVGTTNDLVQMQPLGGLGVPTPVVGNTGGYGGFGVSAGGYGAPGRVSIKRGGKVPGKGNKDTVPALLTPGEFVVRKAVAAKHLAALKRLNRGR